jgi:hypothetical protein
MPPLRGLPFIPDSGAWRQAAPQQSRVLRPLPGFNGDPLPKRQRCWPERLHRRAFYAGLHERERC